MTDPLLTIEDATREFRVSPKTIRRRLTSGEIAGAYKRPGNRGPEWVMPRQSLADAGFTPRPLAAAAAVPAHAEERASYWEQRAIDAEAALQAARDGYAANRRHGLGGLGWAFIGVSLVLALVAGLVILQGRGGSAPEPAAGGAGAMGAVAALLERETEPGDAIGLVGERRIAAIPAGRVVAPSYDRTPRGGAATQNVSPAAPDTAGVPADPTDAVPGEDILEADPPAVTPPLGAGEPAPSDPSPAVVSAELGIDVPTNAVTAYWSALVSANADRLVEPRNADLLHVGQTIVLPPLT